MTALTDNQREALRLLGVYTAGTFRLSAMYGPQKASCRAHIMSALAGARVPQSKAGLHAMQDAFYSIAKPEGSCMAAQSDAFTAWAKKQ